MALFCHGLGRPLLLLQRKLPKSLPVSFHSSPTFDKYTRHVMVLSNHEPNRQSALHSHSENCPSLLSPVSESLTSYRRYAKKPKKDKKGSSKVELSADEMEGILDIEVYRAALQHIVDQQREDYIQHLTLRTTAGVFNTVKVHTDDGTFPISQLGQIAQKSASLVMINLSSSPQYMAAVKEAIVNSGLNVNPQQEGNTLFVPLPKVTKEHRENLSKSAKAICDKSKGKLREVFNKQSRKLKQAKGGHSEDLLKMIQELILDEMHKSAEKAEEMMKAKQNDLLSH